MRHVLFVCGKNRRRSPTAEAVFSYEEGIEALSTGTSADAETPLGGDLIEWADEIVVMEPKQARHIRKKFRVAIKNKRLITLDIPDRYSFMQVELVAELQRKAYRWQSQS